MMSIVFVALTLAACATGAQGQASTVPTDPVLIPAYLANANGSSAFAFNPTLLTGNAATAASSGIAQFPGAGMSQQRTATQLPAIQGSGLSQTYFELEPCALRAAHTHLRASGLLYVINANALAVAFVLPDGPAVINTITTGASTVFPQGMLHYQQNMDCINSAQYLITYNSEDPGTQNQVSALFDLPPDAIQASLGIDRAQLLALDATLATGNIYQNATSLCHQQCSLANVKTLSAETPITGGAQTKSLSAATLENGGVYGRRLRRSLRSTLGF